MPRTTVPLGLLLFLCLTGCNPKTYFRNRGRDLLDVVSADASVGLGVGVHARATVIHTGLGLKYRMHHAGLLEYGPGEHNIFQLREEVQCGLLIFNGEEWSEGRRPAAPKKAELPHKPVSPGMGFNSSRLGWGLGGGACFGEHDCTFFHFPHQTYCEPDIQPLDALDCQLGVNVLVVGARAGFRPGQLLDFLLGWFGVDIGKDDEPEPNAPAPPDSTPGAGTLWSPRPSTSP